MEAKEKFSKVRLETSESIRRDLMVARDPVALYKKAVEILARMEHNFDDALGNKAYDQFDGKFEIGVDKGEFAKKVEVLTARSKIVSQKLEVGLILYALSCSLPGGSLVGKKEVDKLVKELIDAQESVRRKVEQDLEDGKLDNPEHLKVDSKLKTKLEFVTSIGKIIFSELENYSPVTTPKKIDVKNPVTVAFLKEKFSDERNIKATNVVALSGWVMAFCKKSPKILKTLGIKDIRRLTPKEAISLTVRIVVDRLSYSHLQISVDRKLVNGKYAFVVDEQVLKKLTPRQRAKIRENPEAAYNRYTMAVDNASVDSLLKIGRGGICRNYSQVVKMVFESLKTFQKSDTNKLANTYCKQFSSLGKDRYVDNAAEREIVKNHRWNTFYTVLPTGGAEEVVIDATHAEDTGNASFSGERFLFDTIHMVDEGFMTKDQQIAQLEYWLDNGKHSNKTAYKAVSEYVKDYYNEKHPERSYAFRYFIKNADSYNYKKLLANVSFIKDYIKRVVLRGYLVNKEKDNKHLYNLLARDYYLSVDNDKEASKYAFLVNKISGSVENNMWLLYSSMMAHNDLYLKSGVSDLAGRVLKNANLKKKYPIEIRYIQAITNIPVKARDRRLSSGNFDLASKYAFEVTTLVDSPENRMWLLYSSLKAGNERYKKHSYGHVLSASVLMDESLKKKYPTEIALIESKAQEIVAIRDYYLVARDFDKASKYALLSVRAKMTLENRMWLFYSSLKAGNAKHMEFSLGELRHEKILENAELMKKYPEEISFIQSAFNERRISRKR